ncbi:MAG: hypothetical protein IV100_13120 [Myxococcales bacterium]|nr:hypothetical protein [Myxococcales bacterium]
MMRRLVTIGTWATLLMPVVAGCATDDASPTGVVDASGSGEDVSPSALDCDCTSEVSAAEETAAAPDTLPDIPSDTETAPPRPDGGLPLLGADCDPIVPGHCALPFPSDVFLVDDPTGRNKSGKSVRFGQTTLPTPVGAETACPPDLFFDHDGFSPSQAAMTNLPGATTAGCATPHNIERSLDPSSPTVLIEAETGTRVPHWVELQEAPQVDGEPDRSLVLIRPAVVLKTSTRYIVAIRDLTDESGAPIAPSPVFRALRDGEALAEGTPAARWSVYARRGLYDDIFKRLGDIGVSSSGLQIAWDYTTASRDNIQRHALSMRDKALAVVGADGPTFVVKEVTEYLDPNQSPDILRRIELVMTVPLFLTNASSSFEETDPLDRLNLDESGELAQNGTMDQEVLILVPRSVETGAKHGLLQNGHGLFGQRVEGSTGFLARAANQHHYIAFATNFFGFDKVSSGLAAQGFLGRCEVVKSFPERQVQGMVNQLLAMRMMIGRVARDGIKDESGATLLDPSWVDAAVRAYRGDSQGGIMGATYMALSTDVTRGLLGEPGMPYNLLLQRSVDFLKYDFLMNMGFGFNPVANQLVLGMVQMAWDRIEPAGFAAHIEHDPLPGTPSHRVILHVARGDHQVSSLGAHIMARSIGAPLLRAAPGEAGVWESIYGLEELQAPVHDRSVLVEYDFGLEPNPDENKANTDGCDPHDRVRMLAPSYAQQDAFFRTGEIGWFCNEACGCTDGEIDPNEEEGCEESYAALCK